MAFWLPAIASAGGGAAEIVTHGENGYLVQPGDTDALAAHLRAGRRSWAAAGDEPAARQRYEQHPTWAETGERVYRFSRTSSGSSDHHLDRDLKLCYMQRVTTYRVARG